MINQIVYGAEGYVRGSKLEEIWAQNAPGSPRGLFYGIEDDFAQGYTVALTNYQFATRAEGAQPDMSIADTRAALIFNIGFNASLGRHWAALDPKGLGMTANILHRKVSAQLAALDVNQRARNRLELAYAGAALYAGNQAAWRELLGALVRSMTREAEGMPAGRRPPLNAVKKFMDDPSRVPDQILLTYRDRFMFENIKAVADIAAAKKKSAYFVVGDEHVAGLCAKFGDKTYKGLALSCYPSWEQVPQTLRPAEFR